MDSYKKPFKNILVWALPLSALVSVLGVQLSKIVPLRRLVDLRERFESIYLVPLFIFTVLVFYWGFVKYNQSADAKQGRRILVILSIIALVVWAIVSLWCAGAFHNMFKINYL